MPPLQMSPRLGQSLCAGDGYGYEFLHGHAAPPCTPKGTCACWAPLHEGGGVPRPLHRPPLSPFGSYDPPIERGGGYVFSTLLLLVCAPLLGSAGCCCIPPVCARGRGVCVPGCPGCPPAQQCCTPRTPLCVGDGACPACRVAVPFTEPRFLQVGLASALRAAP